MKKAPCESARVTVVRKYAALEAQRPFAETVHAEEREIVVQKR